MTNDYSDFELIQFIYAESSENDEREIKRATILDWNLRERVDRYKRILDLLNKVRFQPSQSSINIILNHDKNVEQLEASF